MKKIVPFLLSVLVICIVAPDPSDDRTSFHSSRAIVMTEGYVWQMGEKRFYHQYRCKVKLQDDGNFVVQRLVGPIQNQRYQTSWHTSADPTGGDFFATLDDHDGSLMVYRRNGGDSTGKNEPTVVYTSNIGDPERLNGLVEPPPRDYKLTINEQCILEIFRGDDVALWTNNRAGGLGGEAGISDYLQKGEMIHMNVCYQNCPSSAGTDCLWYPNALILQHDCNLIQFRGRDWADYLEDNVIVWTSNTREEPAPDDCYLYSDMDKVRLYAGTLDKTLGQFEPRGDPILWDGPDDFANHCSGGYEVLLHEEGGLVPSC